MKKYGFSLIELMIVLAIIGILACIVYPAYKTHIVRTRRTDAIVALNDLAARMEQYYDEHNSYKGAMIKNLGINDNSYYYKLRINSTDDTTYELEAVPISIQAKNDAKCGILILNQLGEKNISGTGAIENCWLN